MYILGISSAQKIVDVALIKEEDLLSHFSLSGESPKTENLILYIEKVLKGNIALNKLSGIAVTVGPGSYGGLRGGLSLAKSISQVHNIPILPVSTLEAVAYNLIDADGAIAVAIPACKKELNVALFGASEGKLNRLTDDLVMKEDKFLSFISKIKGEIHFLGDNNIGAEVAEVASSGVKTGSESNSLPKASNVAFLGLEKFKAGEKLDYINALPRYSHEPNIREYGK